MTTTINNQALAVIEYQDQRVIMFADVDRLHQRTAGTAGRNFRANKKRFIEGEEYFELSSDEIRRQKIVEVNARFNGTIIFLTKTGYLLLVKSLTDDLAWKIQKELIKTYFEAKENRQQLTASYPLLDQSVYHLQQSQRYATEKLWEHEYRIDALEVQRKEIKALKSQTARVERKLRSHLNNEPTITYFGDIMALYNNMRDIYQSFLTCYNPEGKKDVDYKAIYRIVELDGDRLIFRGNKFSNNRMFISNIIKAERIDDFNGNHASSKFKLFLGDGSGVVEFVATKEAERTILI